MENKKSSPYIYMRVLRHADHTVFAVQKGQKFYRDPQFGRDMAYSAGQQVKRSVLEEMTNYLNVPFAPIAFNWYLETEKGNKKKATAKEGLAYVSCDPSFPDQLIGGYMLAEGDNSAIKRRSPLSVSAMRPLHPLLGGMEWQKENMTFDRSNIPGMSVKVYWKEGGQRGEEVSPEDLSEWLQSNNRNLPSRKFIQDQTRASGLFVFDVAIDLRTLFCVSLNRLEPELRPDMETKLREQGWVEGRNVFGSCLICPADKRAEIIPALAHALLNWRITSNQSRTFSPMETLALAISDNANQITYAIRGELKEDAGERPEAVAKLDETARAEMFITPACSGYITGARGSADALDRAEDYLAAQIAAFDFENQIA